jgi:hypothetical protein
MQCGGRDRGVGEYTLSFPNPDVKRRIIFIRSQKTRVLPCMSNLNATHMAQFGVHEAFESIFLRKERLFDDLMANIRETVALHLRMNSTGESLSLSSPCRSMR